MASGSDIEKGHVDESFPVHVERRGVIDEQRKSTFRTELLNAESPLPFSCCIFKVPEVLRSQKEAAYEPHIVSIGPFHRGAEKYQLVENVKKWYLKHFLAFMHRKLTGLGLVSSDDSLGHDGLTEILDSLTGSIKGLGLDEQARRCYEPCFHHEENEFIEMLILDGCFLIELFRKAGFKGLPDNEDPIFNKSCMLVYLYRDLLLLENQLPWFMLEFFYNIIETGDSKPLTDVVIDFFRDSVADANIFSYRDPMSPGKVLHILDLIRTSLIIDGGNRSHLELLSMPGLPYKSLIDHLRHKIPDVVALSEVGVKFKKGPSGCILNITFDHHHGVLTIPPLGIDERTGPLFRNLIAYEQCYHSCAHWITSYAVLMDRLINTNKDVDLLCEEEILANGLSAYDATNFFNDLYNDTTVGEYRYKQLCRDVQKFHKKKWNKWRAILTREYFDSPWSIISFFAAFVLLVLTFLGTIYSIQSYYYSRH